MKNSSVCFILLIAMPFIATSQELSSVTHIAEKLEQNFRTDPKEKFLIQTDKNIYEQGETIWFNVFIVDSLRGKFTRQCKNLFVDLLTNNDSVVRHLLLRGDHLYSDGSFELKDSLLHGLCWLRAYTRKTLDENINNVSVYPVVILNNRFPDDAASLSFKEKKIAAIGKPVIEIYPEGGNLISGANSVVAIKAHDANGQPLMVSGIVRDNRRDTVARFSTNKMGLAKFEFSPTHRRKYGVFILNGNNLDSIATIAASNMYAAQVAVIDQTYDNIHVRVLLEDSLFKRDYESFVICMHNDSVCFASVGKGNYEVNIPTADFPTGEANIFLYNPSQQLLSVRNIFIKKSSNISVSTDKQNYAARENVKMDISVTDNSGKPVIAAMSVSVKDIRIADSSNYFFRDDFASLSSSDLDLLMLASKNNFDKIELNVDQKKKQTKKYLNDTFLVTGHLLNRKKEPVERRQVSLISKDISSFVMQDTTDANGRFSFMVPDFTDSTEFHLQINNLRGTKEEFAIVMDPFHFPNFATPASLKENYYTQLSQKQRELKHYVNTVMGSGTGWLKAVTIKGETSPEKTKIYNGYLITKDMLDGSANSVTNAVLKSGKFHELNGMLVTGGPNKLHFDAEEEPIVVMDGVQVYLSGNSPGTASPVLGFLGTLQSQGIDYIKLLNESESGMYGMRGGRGVIEIHSSNSVTVRGGSATGLAAIHPQGYNVAKPFAMPDYNDKKSRNAKTTDDRLAIFWDANVITDNAGKATVNFFAADMPATYMVTISGVTAKGDKVYKTYTISRK